MRQTLFYTCESTEQQENSKWFILKFKVFNVSVSDADKTHIIIKITKCSSRKKRDVIRGGRTKPINLKSLSSKNRKVFEFIVTSAPLL